MKCKVCIHAKKGYFQNLPDEYVCIGVPEPFIIKDIESECTEYEEYKDEKIEVITVKYNSASAINIGTPCLICGDNVTIIDDKEGPKICDKCKDAVMSLRRLLEYLEEKTNEDT